MDTLRDSSLLPKDLPRLKAIEEQRLRRKIDSYYPDTGPLHRELYPKHLAYFAAGKKQRERAFITPTGSEADGVGGALLRLGFLRAHYEPPRKIK